MINAEKNDMSKSKTRTLPVTLFIGIQANGGYNTTGFRFLKQHFTNILMIRVLITNASNEGSDEPALAQSRLSIRYSLTQISVRR